MDALTIPAAPPQSRLSPSWRGHRQGGACSAACVRHAAWRALSVICLLAWMLWAPACLAANGRLIERAYVLDPSGTMTLEQARSQRLAPFPYEVKQFDNGSDLTVAWLRVRVVPPPAIGPTGIPGSAPTHEYLRLVPLWAKELSVYDVLQLDEQGHIRKIDIPSDPHPSTVSLVKIPVAGEARDLWIRFRPGGPTLLAAEVLSVEQAAARAVWDSSIDSIAIGMLTVLLVIGAVGWWVDRRGIGRALFFKQFLNLALALQSANLLASAGLSEVLALQGPTALQVGLLQVLNQLVSLWFFLKVLELFQAATWALRAQRLLLAAVAANALFLLLGQEGLFRLAGASLHLLVLIVLLMSGFACRMEAPALAARTAWPARLAKQFGLGLLMAMAWIGSFVSGFFKTLEPSLLALIVPVPIVGAIGMLLVVGARRIRQESLRRQQEKREAELRDQALVFERGERQRQQEFMVMLTHELKAPLSTLGMVLGTATPSDSMRRHAGLALASMRQVIDHCAQSVEFEEAEAPMSREACSVWVEVELRHAALPTRERVQLDPDPGLPILQTDRRMLSVIINNLLENALKYSPPGSPVQLSVGRDVGVGGTFQWLRVSNAPLEGPLPDASRLFQKYYRGEATRRSSGSGLGLYLSRLLARRMGGDLFYEGSTRAVSFTLRLPE